MYSSGGLVIPWASTARRSKTSDSGRAVESQTPDDPAMREMGIDDTEGIWTEGKSLTRKMGFDYLAKWVYILGHLRRAAGPALSRRRLTEFES